VPSRADAATRAGAFQPAGREALLRYVLRPPIAQERLELRPDGPVPILARAREAWAKHPVDLTDGVKVRLEDGWFILCASNTQPIVRVIAESATEERARALAERVLADVASWI